MADAMVQMAQEWVNRTYYQVPQFTTIPALGNTGWSTMFALTRALQYELGITTLSDSFGPGTQAALTKLGTLKEGSTVKSNIIRILQCGLWCAGYSGGLVNTVVLDNGMQKLEPNGVFDGALAKGVAKITANMGLGGDAAVTAKIFKGILTMNAYVPIGAGQPAVRECQQWLNSKYLNRQDFYLIPCDGLYSRDVQKALVFALQYEQGMADGVANGSFGPATQTGMKQATAQLSLGTSDANTKKNFVRLYQAALRFNTYYQIPFNGIFDVATQRETLTFQGFSVLPTTGSADFATWASLLVSTGDTTRPTAGCDARDEITEARSTTLRSQSPPIMTVGRYIANVPGGYNKKIQPNEIATLFSHGMKFWPIFQMYANSLDHISRTSGLSDGAAAHVAADGYNLPAGTIIYFAIDFDATGEQISSNVIPYFQGVQQALRTKGGKYRVGVYGSRNVCAQASIQAGAVSSFVSGMSTGFSGNLGFPLPRNWAFDQIANVTIGSGSGQIEIDRNVIRGGNADQGVSSLEAPAGNQAVIAWLRALEAEAEEYIRNSGPGTDRPNFRGPMHLVANYIRSLEPGYSGGAFAILMGGDIIDGFKDQIVAKGIAPFLQIRDSDLNGPVDLPHLMVAAEAVLANGATYPGMDSLDNSFLSDMAGWAGDLVSMVSTYLNSAAIFNGETSLASAYDFMLAGIGTTYNSETKFGPTDIIEDVDGASMAMLWEQGKASSLSLEMEGLYTGTQWTNRYTRFFQLRFGGSWDTATRAVKDVFNSDVVTLVGAARTRVYYAEQVNQDLITDEVKEGFAQAWVEVLRRRVALEG